ncbi:hypothetical protein [Paludisphaera soli]|uniref:hypothetical protein n=1 Tax=Paludisphaera soli TaxID=2712865 RepID=UPI0013EBF8D5|nr:hypothetical protein [Paludisphaera soli]
MLAMFARSYRQAKRPIRQPAPELFGSDVSPGMISMLDRRAAGVPGPMVDEVAAAIKAAQSADVDDGLRPEADAKARLGVGLADDLTAFTIADDRGADVARSKPPSQSPWVEGGAIRRPARPATHRPRHAALVMSTVARTFE